MIFYIEALDFNSIYMKKLSTSYPSNLNISSSSLEESMPTNV